MSNVPTRPENDPSRSVGSEEEGGRQPVDGDRESTRGLPEPSEDGAPLGDADPAPGDAEPDDGAVANDFA